MPSLIVTTGVPAWALQRHLMQYKPRLEECLAEAKLAEGLQADASNESLLPKSARRHIFPRQDRSLPGPTWPLDELRRKLLPHQGPRPQYLPSTWDHHLRSCRAMPVPAPFPLIMHAGRSFLSVWPVSDCPTTLRHADCSRAHRISVQPVETTPRALRCGFSDTRGSTSWRVREGQKAWRLLFRRKASLPRCCLRTVQ